MSHVGRIILKAHTKISLNDRFTVLRRDSPKANENHGLSERRQTIQASRRNQRIAAQMERRPAVMAALNIKSPRNIQTRLNGAPKQLTIKQRLSMPKPQSSQPVNRGSSFRGRGGLRGVRGARGTVRGRGGRGQAFNVSTVTRPFHARGRGRGGFNSPRGGRISRGTIRGRGRRPFSRGSRF